MKETKYLRFLDALNKKLKQHRLLLMSLSVAVVFVTTYLLILPALTLDEQEAAQQGGIDVVEETSEASGENLDQDDQETDASDSDTSAEGELSFDGDGFSVTTSCDAKAGLPLQTELAVTPIDENDENYEAYRDEALAAVRAEEGGESVKDLKFAYFYDISLMSDGEAVEPEAPVDVAISYDKALHVSDAQNLRIVHFAVDEEGNMTPEVLDSDNVALEIEKNKMSSAAFALSPANPTTLSTRSVSVFSWWSELVAVFGVLHETKTRSASRIIRNGQSLAQNFFISSLLL